MQNQNEAYWHSFVVSSREEDDYELIVGIYKPHTILRFNLVFHTQVEPILAFMVEIFGVFFGCNSHRSPYRFFTWKPMLRMLYFCFIEVFYRRDKADCPPYSFKGEKGE